MGVFKSGCADLQHDRQLQAAIGQVSELLSVSVAKARRLRNLALHNDPGKCCSSSRFRLRRFISLFSAGPSRGGGPCLLGCLYLPRHRSSIKESPRSLLLNLGLCSPSRLPAAPTCSSIPHSCFKSLPSSCWGH